MEILQAMLSGGMLRHASGNPSHPFLYGFYLYYVVERAWEGREQGSGQYQGDMEAFSNDWVEVGLEYFLVGWFGNVADGIWKCQRVFGSCHIGFGRCLLSTVYCLLSTF